MMWSDTGLHSPLTLKLMRLYCHCQQTGVMSKTWRWLSPWKHRGTLRCKLGKSISHPRGLFLRRWIAGAWIMLPEAFLQPSQFRVEIGGRMAKGGMCFMEDEFQQAWHTTFAPVLPAIHRPLPFIHLLSASPCPASLQNKV